MDILFIAIVGGVLAALLLVLGEPRVNVLLLNVALDALPGSGA